MCIPVFREMTDVYASFSLDLNHFFLQEEDSCVDDITEKLNEICQVRIRSLCVFFLSIVCRMLRDFAPLAGNSMIAIPGTVARCSNLQRQQCAGWNGLSSCPQSDHYTTDCVRV